MWKRLFRFTGFKLGLTLTLCFVTLKLFVEMGTVRQWMFLDFLENVENSLLDLKFHARGYPKDEADRQAFRDNAHVVICAVDEKSVRSPDLGLWPWPRSATARMVEQLNACNAKVIGFDVVYSEPDSSRAAPAIQAIQERYQAVPGQDEEFSLYLDKTLSSFQGDLQLAKVLEDSENVVLGYFFFTSEEEIAHLARKEIIEEGMESIGFGTIGYMKVHPSVRLKEKYPEALGVRANLPMFTDATEYYGFFNQLPDSDHIYRHVPMLYVYEREQGDAGDDEGQEAGEGEKGEATSTDLVLQTDVFPSLALQVLARYYGQPVSLYAFTNDSKTLLPNFTGLTIGPIGKSEEALADIPVETGALMRLNFYGPQKTFKHVSAGDIIHGDEAACKAVDGKVVLVGVTTMGIYDLRPMPFEPNYPGVELHATAIENVITGDYLSRPYDFIWLEMAIMLLVGLGFSLLLNRLRLTTGLIITLLVWFAVVAVDFLILFPAGLLAQTVLLDVQILVLFLSIAVYRYATEERQKRETRRAFQFYLSSDVIDAVMEDTSKLGLGGERRELTVLFSDIRGFTTISEALPPEELTALLNEYLTPMTDLVFKYRGTLDKYMGDAIMAFYGAPVAFADHPQAACWTALEMMSKLHEMQASWLERGLPEVDIGIGINTGLMSVGNMGSVNRFDYTVMGDHVNLGSRLEGINKQYGSNIIISEFTRAAVGDHFTCRELDSVAVKGKNEPVRIFELLHKGPPLAEEDAWVTRFNESLVAYRAQRWDEAVAGFEALVSSRDDPTSKLYVKRCHDMKTNPPGEDWDGVFKMLTK